MINLILFGPPGSGKGTQSDFLVEKYNLHHISTGDMFRSEIGGKTELGLLAKSYMNKGELVPDEVTISMLKKRVEDNPGVQGYIFDGFPRTVPQAEALDRMLEEMGQSVNLVELKVGDDELRRRLLERGKTSGRADDTNVDTINNRIQVYKDNTIPVATYYDSHGKAAFVEGEGAIEEVTNRLFNVVDSL